MQVGWYPNFEQMRQEEEVTMAATAVHEEEGFSLVELLVVVVVIAILAAIAIPVFLRQRERGWQSQVESALKNASTDINSWAADNGGDFTLPGDDIRELEPGGSADQGLRYAEEVELSLGFADSSGYCIEAIRDGLPTYSISSTSPTPAVGACP
jgi:prepilin-type N-terminal cleavage/methylation domain-containing protein